MTRSDGWVLVPREPTEAMAGAIIRTGLLAEAHNGSPFEAVRDIYRAMLSSVTVGVGDQEVSSSGADLAASASPAAPEGVSQAGRGEFLAERRACDAAATAAENTAYVIRQRVCDGTSVTPELTLLAVAHGWEQFAVELREIGTGEGEIRATERPPISRAAGEAEGSGRGEP